MAKNALLPNGETRFLTVKECAEYLRINQHSLYKMISRKAGPPVRKFGNKPVGGFIRIPKAEFLKWAENWSGES